MKISTDGRGGSNTAAEILNARAAWTAAIDADGEVRDGAWVAEATDLVGLDAWPDGTRLVLRKERPYPGAQLRFTDSDGHRITGFITDTPRGRSRRVGRAGVAPVDRSGRLDEASRFPGASGSGVV